MSLPERLFQLTAHGTTVRTELLAGLTTFLTMSYIVFVNPAILGTTGMDPGAVFVATCLAAALGSAPGAAQELRNMIGRDGAIGLIIGLACGLGSSKQAQTHTQPQPQAQAQARE